MKKIVSLFLALVMLFSMTCSAFAAGSNSTAEYPDMTKEEAMELLGLTEEEMEGMEIHRLSSEEDGISLLNLPSTIGHGVYYEDISLPADFTGAIHRLDGTKFMWGATLMAPTGTTSDNVYGVNVSVRYTTGYPIEGHSLTYDDTTYTSSWYKVVQSKEIYFTYQTFYYPGWTSSAKQTLRVAVAVYNP